MKKSVIFVFLALLAAFAPSAWGFEPRELQLMWEEEGPYPDGDWGEYYCCIGDQNGDGCDDLLVNHDASRVEGAVNAVKLFYGRQEMDSQPDIVFSPLGVEYLGEQIAFLGRLTGDESEWIAISSVLYYNEEHENFTGSRIYFYQLGQDADNTADLMITSPGGAAGGFFFRGSPTDRPSDFNGDGLDDFLLSYWENYHGTPTILLGDNEFDSIPDWTNGIWYENDVRFCTGGDVNGDGYDDFILNGKTLYLGGDPMDTTALWTYESPDTTDRRLQRFVLFPDVNGDGYDDWGCYWTENTEQSYNDGWYLFYGSAHPDYHPDVDLEGSHNVWETNGELCGGDINGDGFGDVITINRSGYGNDGEMHIHFGSRRGISRNPSVSVNCLEEYGDEKSYGSSIGAIGDYNGNSKNDFIVSEYFWGSHTELLCLGGDWEGSVPGITGQYAPLVDSWEVNASPNPFNSTLIVSISGTLSGEFSIYLVDIHGRVVHSKVLSNSGNEILTEISADDLPAGIYFIQCVNTTLNSSRSTIKKVALLR